MKTILLAVTACVLLLHSAEAKRYGAGAGSNYEYTGGAISLVTSYRSASSAVNAARYRNPGYSPLTWRWWSHARYCAIARGYAYDYYYDETVWNFGYAYGYRSRSSALNRARSYTYSSSRSWISGYNRS